MTDQEILDSVLSNDRDEEEEDKDKDSEVNNVPTEKPKCWLLECCFFFLTTIEVKSSSHKLSLETKKQSKMLNFFQKIVTLLVILL